MSSVIPSQARFVIMTNLAWEGMLITTIEMYAVVDETSEDLTIAPKLFNSDAPIPNFHF